MRRNAGVLIAASLLLSACGAVNVTSATNSESAGSPSVTASSVSPSSEPAAAPVSQIVPDNTNIVIERSVPADSTPAAPSYLAKPAPVPAPAPPSTIRPLIVAQSAEVEAASVAPSPATTPAITVPPTTQAPVVTAPLASLPPVTTAPPAPVTAPPITAPPVTAPPVTAPPVTAPPLAPAGLPVDWAAATRFVSDINGLRSGLGLPALTRSAELDSLALGWAQTMAAGNNMSHSGIIHSLVNRGTWTGAAENVGYGSDETIVFNALVASPSHYVNMVNPAYTQVGTAVVVAGNLIWTAHLFVG